jgi:hypothetical protein
MDIMLGSVSLGLDLCVTVFGDGDRNDHVLKLARSAQANDAAVIKDSLIDKLR